MLVAFGEPFRGGRSRLDAAAAVDSDPEDHAMKRSISLRALLLRGWPVRFLVLGLALSAVACGDVNFNPMSPTIPWGSNAGLFRTLTIQGRLTAGNGLCLEATVLYDGEELDDARAVCEREGGCATLDLSARARTGPGKHTLSFRVLRQTNETIDYVANATIVLQRDGISLVATLPLGSQHRTLRAGESITFEFEFTN